MNALQPHISARSRYQDRGLCVWIAPTRGVYEKLASREGVRALSAPPGSVGTQVDSEGESTLCRRLTSCRHSCWTFQPKRCKLVSGDQYPQKSRSATACT